MSESRLGRGNGELLIRCGDGVDLDDIGIDEVELRLAGLVPNEASFRKL